MKNMESGPKRSQKEAKGSQIHDAGVKRKAVNTLVSFTQTLSIVCSEWHFAICPIRSGRAIGRNILHSQRLQVLFCLFELQRCTYFLHGSHFFLSGISQQSKQKAPTKLKYLSCPNIKRKMSRSHKTSG
jgi:hypothetical protein